MQFLRKAWYMAGWADEIGEAGLARRIAGRPTFLYRLADGNIAALLDRCPHRFAPLSKGTRDGDRVVCGYHGLAFTPDGHCAHNPFAARIPAGSDIPAFAVAERDGIAWVWGDEPSTADPALIPDFGFIPDTAHSRTVRGYTLMQANYEYGTDNLLDLSHIEFVHKGTFAGQGVIFAGQHSVTVEADTLHSNWWMPDIAPPSVAYGIFPPDAKVDHWLDMRWNAPASMRLHVGVAPHGAPREAGFEVPQAHILTPADEHSTHYFWSTTRFNDLDDAGVDAMLKALFGEAFDLEDKPMIEAAYDNVRGRDFWQEKPLSLGIDQGGTRARRILEKMRAQERATG
ncbi:MULTISPECIES: aromatic ring-hydroxylating dioxygenase subunit alpha [unclassified Novosphingobium]|uniref:aromatic ring-hydroxylating dioxygenase subunit alpha n=1 Tax=unclassified Novosphingobium TaxID=2644732 RepID=UPI00146DBE2B|nr:MULTISPECIES: aromatic ring-hydroxylating dioxygenase subunit alpha [unclassified Novosphingobium]NMN04542.1 vanillate O-demethylase monooxygenase subunit [Novosphingobium sp. SG919]NMN85465.1 vanillate O-demethylase monooxygenase subunit [Novosphingobium sp. SG916]